METSKKRPYAVVSNNQYNDLLNTLIVAPISSSPKYQENTKYRESSLFIDLPDGEKINGTILLQHLRSIDSNVRIN
ncbi:hypothetical protein RV12_GL000417 [Enterococcus quebecensis]|nr:hypothetical protein RV12_GL000417 [Enterococcus quebecensis]